MPGFFGHIVSNVKRSCVLRCAPKQPLVQRENWPEKLGMLLPTQFIPHRWFIARLQKLQCVSNRITAVLH